MPCDLTTWTDEKLTSAYGYDRREGCHTYSDCRQNCGHAGRGGGPCWRCIRAELVRRLGEAAADAALSADAEGR